MKRWHAPVIAAVLLPVLNSFPLVNVAGQETQPPPGEISPGDGSRAAGTTAAISLEESEAQRRTRALIDAASKAIKARRLYEVPLAEKQRDSARDLLLKELALFAEAGKLTREDLRLINEQLHRIDKSNPTAADYDRLITHLNTDMQAHFEASVRAGMDAEGEANAKAGARLTNRMNRAAGRYTAAAGLAAKILEVLQNWHPSER
jgi:hypothetical protein